MHAGRTCLSLSVLAGALSCAGQAYGQLIVFPSPFSTTEQQVMTSVSTQFIPGQFRERQLASESRLQIRPGLSWQISTGFYGTRYDQVSLFRTQTARLTTGPQLKWGAIELAVPLQAGQEVQAASGDAQWASGMPRMTVQLGADDSIKLEANASTRQENTLTRTSKSKRSVALSWRHAFNERFAVRTGLERSSETIDHSLESSESAQAFAQLSASLPSHWRLVFGGSLYQGVNHSGLSTDDASKDRSQSLSLSANRPLLNGWTLSGTLSLRHTLHSDLSAAFNSGTGNLRLSRDF